MRRGLRRRQTHAEYAVDRSAPAGAPRSGRGYWPPWLLARLVRRLSHPLVASRTAYQLVLSVAIRLRHWSARTAFPDADEVIASTAPLSLSSSEGRFESRLV